MRYIHYEHGRYWLRSPYDPELVASLKLTEGSRWEPGVKMWSLPASLRAWKKAMKLGFVPAPEHAAVTVFRNAAAFGVPHALSGSERTIGSRTLMMHQEQGVRWLENRERALLCDEQGLGKTLQAVTVGLASPTVIVCAPRVLLPQWAAELELTGEANRGVVHVGTGSKMLSKVEPGSWYLANYERLAKMPLPTTPYAFIVDEVVFAKNTKTTRAKAVLKWAEQAERVIGLTGSVVTNRPLEAWSLYLMMRERTKKEFFRWANRYCGAFQTPYGWDFSGATFLEELGEDMKHFLLRRTKEEVLTLPPKLRSTLRVPAKSAALDKAENEVLSYLDLGYSLQSGVGLASVQHLRVESALSKVEFAGEWLRERTTKTVVFSEFKEPLRRLANNVPGMLLCTGDQTDDERIAAIHAFTHGENLRSLGCTYAVGEKGLNLQVADTVLVLDLPWTPTALEQAEDRVHRIGQGSTVNIVTLLSGRPIEDHMLRALESKQDIITGILSMGKMTPFKL